MSGTDVVPSTGYHEEVVLTFDGGGEREETGGNTPRKGQTFPVTPEDSHTTPDSEVTRHTLGDVHSSRVSSRDSQGGPSTPT